MMNSEDNSYTTQELIDMGYKLISIETAKKRMSMKYNGQTYVFLELQNGKWSRIN